MLDVVGLCSSLDKALDLKVECHELFMQCAEHIQDLHGQEFFRYLAGEELIQHDKIAEIYKREFNQDYSIYSERVKRMKEKGTLLRDHSIGGSLDDRSNIICALNLAVNIKKDTCKLYEGLVGGSDNSVIKGFFKELAEDEVKHRILLEAEIESVTEAGCFKDFKVIVSHRVIK